MVIILNIKDENGRLSGDMTMTGDVEGRGFLSFLEAWAITLFQPSHQISSQIYCILSTKNHLVTSIS